MGAPDYSEAGDIAAHNERMEALALERWNAKLPEDPMTNTAQMIQSKYLSKADVPVPVIATIKGVSLEHFNNQQGREGKDSAWLLWFAELPKGLKLNNTNIRILEAGFGPETDLWAGKRVKVYVDMTIQMAGQTVGGIRLQTPTVPAVALTAGAVPIPPGARFDPVTGQPLAQAAPAAPRFDPMTGLPLAAGAPGKPNPFLPGAGQPVPADAEFNDDIPF